MQKLTKAILDRARELDLEYGELRRALLYKGMDVEVEMAQVSGQLEGLYWVLAQIAGYGGDV